MAGWGPVRPRQLGKMECQGKAINILAKAGPKNVNGGVEQWEKMFSSDRMGFFVCFKNMFFPLKTSQLGSSKTGCPELASCPVGLEQRLLRWKVSGQVLGKIHAFEAQKSLTPLTALAFGEGTHLPSSLGTHSPARCQECHQRIGASPHTGQLPWSALSSCRHSGWGITEGTARGEMAGSGGGAAGVTDGRLGRPSVAHLEMESCPP